jgi:carboxyl-terminal processing protease
MKYCLRILFVAACFIFPGCESLLIPENSDDYNLNDFEEAWQIVGDTYPFFELKEINWDSLYSVYREEAEVARGDEIFNVLFDMLKELKDGHVGLSTQGGEYIMTYIPKRKIKDTGTYSPYVVRNYFPYELRVEENKKIEYGITNSNVGYIHISTFMNNNWAENDLNTALDYVRDTKGLIIDVRDNGGGSDLMGEIVIKRLISDPILSLPVRRNGEWTRRVPINPGGEYQYTKPVIILTNGVCFSATEDFIATIEQAENITVVGDTTGGGSSAPQVYALTSGKSIRVSTIEICRSDSIAIEWNGVVPDIQVSQTREDIGNNIDKQLGFAIDFLD